MSQQLLAICNPRLLVLCQMFVITAMLLVIAASEEVEEHLESEETSACKFAPSSTTCEKYLEDASPFQCIGLRRDNKQNCAESPPSLVENPIELSESISEEHFHFTDANKQICFTPKKSKGSNWNAFFGYILELDFFNTDMPGDKITSRLLVSFPQGLQSEEEFTNSAPCIRTPKEFRYNETSFSSTVYLVTVAKPQIINQKHPFKLSDINFVEAEEEDMYEYAVPEIETTKKHIVIGLCGFFLIFLSVIGLFGLCLKIYRRCMLAKKEKRQNSTA